MVIFLYSLCYCQTKLRVARAGPRKKPIHQKTPSGSPMWGGRDSNASCAASPEWNSSKLGAGIAPGWNPGTPTPVLQERLNYHTKCPPLCVCLCVVLSLETYLVRNLNCFLHAVLGTVHCNSLGALDEYKSSLSIIFLGYSKSKGIVSAKANSGLGWRLR